MGLDRHCKRVHGRVSTGTCCVVEIACVLHTSRRCCSSTNRHRASCNVRARRSPSCSTSSRTPPHAAFVIIEHDMPLVHQLSDRIVCMHLEQLHRRRHRGSGARRSRRHRQLPQECSTCTAPDSRSDEVGPRCARRHRGHGARDHNRKSCPSRRPSPRHPRSCNRGSTSAPVGGVVALIRAAPRRHRPRPRCPRHPGAPAPSSSSSGIPLSGLPIDLSC